ncbi:hypothetical protein F5Y15DRAFT_164864 [Xylariaceae sp. FL0016]|nr:hypothetical protein F5Y15DRAFT_164864 [Xylariaceae sp. FL0016]
MAEEPTLPTLPAVVSWDADTQTFANTRKRQRNQPDAPSSLFNSSDPAVFSSDDDPHVDNYMNGKHRKKRYVGSWYQQQPASSDSAFSEERRPPPVKTKRSLKRQLDSGVWMGSDASTDFDDETFPTHQPEPRLSQLRYARPAVPISPTEDIVRQKIQTAIDGGNEDIDLSSMGITDLSNVTISQLNEFSCIPIVAEGVPFEQKTPELRLYLSSNPLHRAPGALFNLEYLTVLSLRNAQISELPPSVGNLRNLHTLNLSLNRLRYLPAQLLDLIKYGGKLRNLTVHPNPFHQPSTIIDSIDEEYVWDSVDSGDDDGKHKVGSKGRVLLLEVRKSNNTIVRSWLEENPLGDDITTLHEDDPFFSRWQAFIVARSPVQYSDSRGVVLSKFRLPSGGSECDAVETEQLSVESTPSLSGRGQNLAGARRSRVFSLFELALQACARTPQLGELAEYLPPQTPSLFSDVLERTVEQGEQNSNNLCTIPCSVCKRPFIMPTAQWYEWWHLDQPGNPYATPADILLPQLETFFQKKIGVPFLRSGCSWNCVPKQMKKGQLLPGLPKSSIELRSS